MKVVDVQNLNYSIDSSVILKDISFSVDKGDFLGIIGPNGAGKTILFYCILGLIENYDGKIEILGSDIRKNPSIRKKIGYVPQKRTIHNEFPATAEEIVSMAISERNSIKKVHSVLKLVDLFEQRNKQFNQLSGGQQQRLLIAKAIVNNPLLLILDEPTNAVDPEQQHKFFNLINKLNKHDHVTIIWSSHDLDAIAVHSNKIGCINKRLFFHGTSKDFSENKKLLDTFEEFSMYFHMHSHEDK